MRNRGVLLSAPLLVLLLFACTKEAARVSGTVITERDLAYRAKVSGLLYPGRGEASVVLAQLIKGYLSEEVLKSLGQPPSDEIIEAEARRIDVNTRAPELLRAIKAVYGNDRGRYLKTFVRPVYAERALYRDIFLKSTDAKKMQYDEWFWEKASKIPVRIHDRGLRVQIAGQVAWFRLVNLR